MCSSNWYAVPSSIADAAVVNQFAHNLLSLDVAEQLTSLISEAEEHTREKIPAVEQEWEGKCCQLYQKLKLYMHVVTVSLWFRPIGVLYKKDCIRPLL